MPLRTSLKTAVVSAVIAAVTTLAAAPAGAAPGVQVVTSSGGVAASGSAGFFPDSARSFQVTFVVPQGTTTETPAIGSVDFGKPWAAISEWGTDHETPLCSQVANPASYGGGASAAGSADIFNAPVWKGTFVDLTCNDNSGYDFYRAQWDPAQYWPLIKNPIVTNTSQDQVTRWQAGATNGLTELYPEAEQVSSFTVCGYRAATETFTCYGQGRWEQSSTGHGVVLKSSLGGMNVIASST